jgi:hypothetical protein
VRAFGVLLFGISNSVLGLLLVLGWLRDGSNWWPVLMYLFSSLGLAIWWSK